MKFQPKTIAQLNEENKLPDGEYDFEVLEAKDTVSRANNEMIELKVKVYTGNGHGFRIMSDFLLESMAFKLIHFCEGVGLGERYAKGQLKAEDCKGRAGRCRIGWQKSKDPAYEDKNAIKDYVCEENEEEAAQAPTASPEQPAPPDDDVPF